MQTSNHTEAKFFCQHCQKAGCTCEESAIVCDDVVENGTNEVMFESLRRLVLRIRPQWDESTVNYKIFTGGATNRLFGLFSKGIAPEETILFRVYGNRTELYIDRPREWQNLLTFHQLNLASHPFLRFANGVAYEFLEGQVGDYELVCDPVVSDLIALEFACMHTESTVRDNDFYQSTNGKSSSDGSQTSRSLTYIEYALELFYGLIPASFQDKDKQARFVSVFDSLAALRSEVDDLLADLVQLDAPIAYCHNDLLMGNIIYQRGAGRVRFIDWEYAAPNFAAFDIANHFVEFGGFDNANFDLYPPPPFQHRFLRTYLAECKRLRQQQRNDSQHVLQQNGKSEALQTLSEAELDRWFVHVQHLSVATLLMWVLWALVQAHISTLSTDFMTYAVVRYAAYKKVKLERLALKPSVPDSMCE